MIGDPLHDFLKERQSKREAKARRPAPAPRPEGVAFYKCQGLVLEGEDLEVGDPSGYRALMVPIGCGRTAEAAPWARKPRCHDRDMAITGYNWDRDAST